MITRSLSFLLLLYALGYAAFAVLLPKPGDERTTDGIVVLTGGAGRMERGLELMVQGKAKRMLVSGVDRSVRPIELVRHHEADPALFKCCIDLGREAVDTRSNAEETTRWAKRHKLKTVRLVTTDWHMPRAGFELARQAGDAAEVYGDAVPSKPRFTTLFTEYNKYLLRRAAVLVGI
jgi:uncharacterized SAM-binding protein YcdF (DUF218 family)